MILLIDYDNLRQFRNRGLSQNIQMLLDKIPPSDLASTERVHCRLYGGWLTDRNRHTKNAQDLLKQIDEDFPRRVRLYDRQTMMRKPELATSLVCDPHNDFPHTFRVRPPVFNVRRFPLDGCIERDNCSIAVVNSFVYNQTCVRSNCDVSPREAFFRLEQKLVDSMIVVDMVYFATRQQKHVVLVSGDNDMWPGIRYALLNDTHLTHIIPSSSWRSSRPYKHLVTSRYIPVKL